MIIIKEIDGGTLITISDEKERIFSNSSGLYFKSDNYNSNYPSQKTYTVIDKNGTRVFNPVILSEITLIDKEGNETTPTTIEQAVSILKDFEGFKQGGGGGASVTVTDNLNSFSSTDALSANQGRVLKGLIDDIDTDQVYKEYIDKALPFAQILLEPKTYTDISAVAGYDDTILTVTDNFVRKTNGALEASNDYNCSEPFAIIGVKKIVITDIINTSEACAVAFYNDASFISAPVGSAAYGDISTIEVPSNATHVRFSYYKQGGYTFSAKLLRDFTLSENQLAFTNEDNEVVKIFTIIDPENTWSTTGNTDTDPNVNFIGTIDNKDFIIKSSGIEKMRFTNMANAKNGNIFITDSPPQTDPYNYAKLSMLLTKANPIFYNYLCRYIQDSNERNSAIRMRVATSPGGGFTRAKVGDVLILKTGEGSLIIGTGSTIISTNEPKSISIKPNNVTYPTADRSNLGLNVRAFWDTVKNVGVSYTGINTDDPTDFLTVDSKIANDSGITILRLSPDSPVLTGAKPLGIDANNKVGIADIQTTTPSLQQVTEKGSVTTRSIQVGNEDITGILNSGNIRLKNGDSNCLLNNTSLKLAGGGESGEDNPLFTLDTANNIVDGKAELVTAFNEWLQTLKQEKYTQDYFDFQFNSDLTVNGFSVTKTGKLIFINAFFSIQTSESAESINLFKIPDELKPDPAIQSVNGIVNIYRTDTISRKYLRDFELITSSSEVVLNNTPFTGIDDQLTDLNNTQFGISLTYSMQ